MNTELGLELPEVPKPVAKHVQAKRVGELRVSGQAADPVTSQVLLLWLLE